MPIKTLRPAIRPSPKPIRRTFSDDYYSDDDLPQITTAKDTNKPNLLSDYSYEESSYESYSTKENWKTPTTVHHPNPVSPSPRPPPPVRTPTSGTRPLPSRKNSRPIPRTSLVKSPSAPTRTPQTPNQEKVPAEISDGYDNYSGYEYSDVGNQPSEPQPQPKIRQSPVSNDIAENHLSKAEEQPQVAPQHPAIEKSEVSREQNQQNIAKVDDTTENNIGSNLHNNSYPQINHGVIQEDNNEEKTFQIVYEQSNVGNFWKRQVQMTKDDILVFICKSFKKKPYGKVHIICTKTPVEMGSPNYAGMIVRHQSGSRFTLYGKGDDVGVANPQIAGIAFTNLRQNSRIRMFHVALPEEGTTYNPVDKHLDLSRIAYKNEPVPNVQIFSSAIPIKKKDGTLSLNFGPYSIVRSTKNFVVRDDKNVAVFTIFKTFDGICTLKVRPPFTPFVGFAIAVAISTSTK